MEVEDREKSFHSVRSMFNVDLTQTQINESANTSRIQNPRESYFFSLVPIKIKEQRKKLVE